ncbi:MAG: type II toxin-antitoxin system VapC family toxin [Gammaproteobacteria bacterium]|nr:type II toxin-antitoxin system VapC family toxin [Gammaproteobacteria bacterium]MCH9743944.1 type II toxin-antitoxin system VapC family toxin [Gammaproteobacteria bacterium]
MNYILDTDIISNLINKKSPHQAQLIKKIQNYSPRQVYMSIFTKCELYFGLARIDKRKQEYKVQLTKAINNFVTRINILDLSLEFAETYAAIRSELVSKGNDIGVIDCMIATQAITHNYTLVSHNIRHYQRIQKNSTIAKLKLADWIK